MGIASKKWVLGVLCVFLSVAAPGAAQAGPLSCAKQLLNRFMLQIDGVAFGPGVHLTQGLVGKVVLVEARVKYFRDGAFFGGPLDRHVKSAYGKVLVVDEPFAIELQLEDGGVQRMDRLDLARNSLRNLRGVYNPEGYFKIRLATVSERARAPENTGLVSEAFLPRWIGQYLIIDAEDGRHFEGYLVSVSETEAVLCDALDLSRTWVVPLVSRGRILRHKIATPFSPALR